MRILQGFRVLHNWSRQQSCKVWSGSIENRSLHHHNHAFHGGMTPRNVVSISITVDSLLIKCVNSMERVSSRLFSSGSGDNSVDKERQKMKNDPEIRAWMNQIAQDFENAPFQALVDEPHRQENPDMPSSNEKTASLLPEETNLDIEVEEFGYIEDDEDDFEDPVSENEKHVPVPLERGQHGVFDVEEIVAVLDEENGVDIQVIEVPPEARFVDHMVIVSGKSLRHMRAMAASIEWLYKRKKRKSDRHFKLEGRDCKDWFAMDLGNIAVHIFTPTARQHYDLETLWTLGPEHDNQRHYVHDDSLNLTAADLFWLEKGSSEVASSSQKTEDTNSSSGDSDNVPSTDQSLNSGEMIKENTSKL